MMKILQRKLPFEIEELNEKNARMAEKLRSKDEFPHNSYETSSYLAQNVKKEEPLDISDHSVTSIQQETQESIDIQSCIKKEPLEIKQELIEDFPSTVLFYPNNSAKIKISPEPMKEFQKTFETNFNETSRKTLNSIFNKNQIQLPVSSQLKNREDAVAIEQLLKIYETPPEARKRKSNVIIVAKASPKSKPILVPSNKHITCFICHDKFSSQLTFQMHVKLMHKTCTKIL